MKMKKIMSIALVATLTMASCLTAVAKTSTAPAAVVNTEVNTSVFAECVEDAGAAISVAGVDVKTTIAGSYGAESVAGMAVVTASADISAALGLADGETPYVVAYDTDPAKSPLAMAVVNAVAEALGAKVVSTVTIDLGYRSGNMFYTAENGSAAMVIGINEPDITKTYSVVCVQPGGVLTILEDKDTELGTVTVDVQAGLGTYAIVAK